MYSLFFGLLILSHQASKAIQTKTLHNLKFQKFYYLSQFEYHYLIFLELLHSIRDTQKPQYMLIFSSLLISANIKYNISQLSIRISKLSLSIKLK